MSQASPHVSPSLLATGKSLRDLLNLEGAIAVLSTFPKHGRDSCYSHHDCLARLLGNPVLDLHICINPRTYRDWIDRIRNLNDGWYHIQCFERLVNIPHLCPLKLRLARGEWGLMVRKWWMHSGHININTIASYILKWKLAEWEDQVLNPGPTREAWWRAAGHGACIPNQRCWVPVPFVGGQLIMLREYVTPGRTVSLAEVLRHPLVWELPREVWTHGRCETVFWPEGHLEDEEEHFVHMMYA
ncbi:hypothetical protein IMZ48_30490 [Candidatus Bathyarchaeota archaeon]|nr:hypothetical protein [Candidatus Bathyarchaeota archaeon]